jgi:hypothetical protein
MHEPWGEGNGWDDCSDDLATAFVVVNTDTDDAIEAFDTKQDAQQYIKARGN